jgi:exodeoxyribonuclease VII small subunit
MDDFEKALAELERIVAALDSDELGLDEAMALFEEGILHVRAANLLLEETRGKVEELITQSTGELSEVEFSPPEPEDESDGDGDRS